MLFRKYWELRMFYFSVRRMMRSETSITEEVLYLHSVLKQSWSLSYFHIKLVTTEILPSATTSYQRTRFSCTFVLLTILRHSYMKGNVGSFLNTNLQRCNCIFEVHWSWNNSNRRLLVDRCLEGSFWLPFGLPVLISIKSGALKDLII